MDKRFVLAARYYEAGLDAEAWPLVQEMLSGAPAAEAFRLAALLRFRAGALAEAVAYADQALALGDTAICHVKGRALHGQGDLAGAEAALRAAIAVTPTAQLWSDLGNVLADAGNPAAAMDAYTRAIALDPAFAEAHNNLGVALGSQGAYHEAEAAYRAALAAAPRSLSAQVNLGVALLEQGDVAQATAAFDAVLAAAPGHKDAADNRLYGRLYVEEDPARIAADHAAWGKSLPAAAPLPLRDPDPGRRLRVGYVSADFRRHSVAFFLAPFFAAHDPAAVEVTGYADVLRPDAVTRDLAAQADHWRNIHGLSDATVRQQVLADRIDILVDLSGHTQGNRLGLFAARAAPIQATALGYPAGTGVPAMDYRLCDAVTDPPGTEAHSGETPMRLPHMHCFSPPSAPPCGPLPAARGPITFGSFNKLAKISPACVALWAAALAAVPGARLLIKSKALAEEATARRLADLFARAGVSPSRLMLSGWLPDGGDHMARYGEVDIALDTFPYNGTTTTCEALWMGVPVLTMAGRGHASRVSASLLTAVGLTDWIAPDVAAFAAKAAAKSADIAGLSALRGDLRARMAASALCDAPAQARALEAAYRAMWQTRLRSNSTS